MLVAEVEMEVVAGFFIGRFGVGGCLGFDMRRFLPSGTSFSPGARFFRSLITVGGAFTI
jgi:hypothetical protein